MKIPRDKIADHVYFNSDQMISDKVIAVIEVFEGEVYIHGCKSTETAEKFLNDSRKQLKALGLTIPLEPESDEQTYEVKLGR